MIRKPSFTGKEKIFSVRRHVRTELERRRIYGCAQVFRRSPMAVLIEADVKIALAQTLRPIVRDKDQEALIGRDVGISVGVFGIDLVPKVLWFGVFAVDQPRAIDIKAALSSFTV